MTFFRNAPRGDEEYRRLFAPEFDRELEARLLVENLWSRTASFVDPDLPERAPDDFHARFLEMYLAAGLMEGGVTLAASTRVEGPDLRYSSANIYVEAIAPTAGTGPNAVPAAVPNVVRDVPVNGISLRMRAAIEEKHRKYQGYRERSILGPSDAFVIAINGAAIPSARGDDDPPFIVKCVFPVGNRVLHIDRTTLRVTETSFEPQFDLETAAGSPVAKGIFLNETYSGISAVLYACVDPYNHAERPGQEFIVVHNAMASNPIAPGVIPCTFEYVLEGEHLRRLRGTA